ncbi:MAG: GNAT family N-acetyltransferase [Candidatus Pacebacteria bacterium]|nr:GNAT family N-acetyltransferase [Candidatus Paceibacterota bacterium]
MLKIQSLTKKDISAVAKIANQCFRGYGSFSGAKKWLSCNFGAYPRMQYFLAKEKDEILGYILWLEKGGFRKEAVWELEQIAIKETARGRGVATFLIEQSLKKILSYLKERGSKLKTIEVTTGTENQAQRLYQKTLNARPEAVIKDFFRGDEVIMIARL